MRVASLILTAGLVMGTAAAGPAEEEFPNAMQALKEAKELAPQCRVGPDHPHGMGANCYDAATPHSFQGCVAFDQAMQVAVGPLGTCADRIAEDPKDAACDEYLDELWTECGGVHAVYLAHHDRGLFTEYERAVRCGTEEGKAAELYLSRIVRIRK